MIAPPTEHRSERLRQYRALMVVVALLIVFAVLWTARSALLPFGIGLVFSYLISPLVGLVQRLIPNRWFLRRARRVIAVLIVYSTVIGVLVAIGMSIGPRLVDQTVHLTESMPQYVETIQKESEYWNRWYVERISPENRRQVESYFDDIGGLVSGAASSAVKTTFGTVQRVIGFLFGLLLLPLWTFYLLKDQPKGAAAFYRMFPEHLRPDVRNVIQIADRVLGAYVRGQLLLGFIVGIATFVGLHFLGIQYAVPLAVVGGLFEMVPIIGPWISGTVGVIVILATDPDKIWWAIVLFVMIQQVENTFLVPKVQGDAVDVNPAIIMVLLVVAGAAFGLLGVIIIVPVFAIIRDVFVYIYGRLGEEAELAEAEEELSSG